MPTALSNEGRIAMALRELNVPARNFVDLAKSLNVSISHGRFSEALNGKAQLDSDTGTKLIELLVELKTVSEQFKDVPINWAATERLATLIVLMRVEQAALQLNQENQIAVSKELLENALRANAVFALGDGIAEGKRIPAVGVKLATARDIEVATGVNALTKAGA